MTKWWVLPVSIAMLGSCRGTTSGNAPKPTSAPGSTTTSTAAILGSTMPLSPPVGSVTLQVASLRLRAGQSFRALMETASNTVTVVVSPTGTGSSGSTPVLDPALLEACPVADLESEILSDCTEVGADGSAALQLGRSTRGVAVRPRSGGGAGRIPDLDAAVTFVPSERVVSLLLPALEPGVAGPSITLSPSGSGPFHLEARPRRGRARLTLVAGSGTQARTVATVEGGTRLSINATVDGDEGATLRYSNPGSEEVPALSVTTRWP